MKILNSKTISSFGGINFVLEELNKKGVHLLLQHHLPNLPPQSKYKWYDLLYSFWSIFFCGGDCIEDLSINLKGIFDKNPFCKLPSPDRVLERMKSLSVQSQMFSAPRGNAAHHFSINNSLNLLNIRLLKKLSLLGHKNIVLDYDNTLLFARKKDAAMTYKNLHGYSPGVGIIGKNIIYVENRNGNSQAANLQEDTLSRMFNLLRNQKVKVNKFRADGASYKLSTLSVIERNTDKFYIRANMSVSLTEAIKKIENWKELVTDGARTFRGSVMFVPFEKIAKRSKYQHPLKEYRLIVTKEERYDGQFNLFTGEPYNYRAIITNDHDLSNDQIVEFYNQRGAIEKEFDILKNDFGWNNMPFSKLEYNTVFLLFTAMCRNIYQYIICLFSKVYKNLLPNYRIKKFIFRFICMPAKWIKSGRMYKLRLYGKIAFKT